MNHVVRELGQLFHKISTVAPAFLIFFFFNAQKRELYSQIIYRQHAKSITRSSAKPDKIDLVKMFNGKKKLVEEG